MKNQGDEEGKNSEREESNYFFNSHGATYVGKFNLYIYT